MDVIFFWFKNFNNQEKIRQLTNLIMLDDTLMHCVLDYKFEIEK